MTAKQQIGRLLPLVLLVVLVIAGLRGAVAAPRWNGPLKSAGVPIGLALELILGALLVVTLRRDGAASRAAERLPYTSADTEIKAPAALRWVLKYVLGASMIAVAVVLISNLHLHYFGRPPSSRLPLAIKPKIVPKQVATHAGGGWTLHIPWGPILYGLLVLVLLAAVVISIWWSTRLRRPAPPLPIADLSADELREAVESGRVALAGIDDARAAIIACYIAMEQSLADRGARRAVADTPDELLARAVAANVVRGGGAGRLTTLFYEARFSTHALVGGQRDAASAALDELAAELAAAPVSEPAPAAKPSTGGGRA
jgi:Domain of unknown function (DUF4129)